MQRRRKGEVCCVDKKEQVSAASRLALLAKEGDVQMNAVHPSRLDRLTSPTTGIYRAIAQRQIPCKRSCTLSRRTAAPPPDEEGEDEMTHEASEHQHRPRYHRT